ncbi:hypothetical protein [Microcoleus sp. FACHB-672]|uniref:hypothetical protein n=1 Tax=Microcoleus sp. FACHB-672 TaxID=2692825 RepID=UPI001682CC77|nr:hypothetical protein [Microcoleus sp. FACHB-672]MBD2043828.1 hypothetical protein [Microcoleus sp. FACHB-672]
MQRQATFNGGWLKGGLTSQLFFIFNLQEALPVSVRSLAGFAIGLSLIKYRKHEHRH